MIDRLLSIGATFDWITPIWVFIQQLLNRPSTGFLIPLDDGLAPSMVEDMLRSHGVKVFGVMLNGNDLLFSVPKAQADYARYLLEREGFLFQGKAKKPSKVKSRRGWLTDMERELDDVISRLLEL